MRQVAYVWRPCRPASLGWKAPGVRYLQLHAFDFAYTALRTPATSSIKPQPQTIEFPVKNIAARLRDFRNPFEVNFTLPNPFLRLREKTYNLEDPHPSPAAVGGLARSWQHGSPQTTSDRPTRTTRAMLYMRICSTGTSRLRLDLIHRR